MFVRLYTGSDGESYFEDVHLDYRGSETSPRTPMHTAQGVIFGKDEAGVFGEFHAAPNHIYSVNLSGQVEIGLGSGEVKTFGPGDILEIDEDPKGRGHTYRIVGDEPRVFMMVRV